MNKIDLLSRLSEELGFTTFLPHLLFAAGHHGRKAPGAGLDQRCNDGGGAFS